MPKRNQAVVITVKVAVPRTGTTFGVMHSAIQHCRPNLSHPQLSPSAVEDLSQLTASAIPATLRWAALFTRELVLLNDELF
jgi:hypothetical protein